MMVIGSTAMLAVNILTLWVLIEAYVMKPRGFHGPPWLTATAYTVMVGNIILLAVNFTLWTLEVIRFLWSANG